MSPRATVLAVYAEYDLNLPALAWRRDEPVTDDAGRARVRGLLGLVAREGNRTADRSDTRAVRMGEAALLVETDLGHADQTGRPTRVSVLIEHPFSLGNSLDACADTVIRVLADAGLDMAPASVRAALTWGLASTRPLLPRLDALLRRALRILSSRRRRWNDQVPHTAGDPA